MDVTFHQENEPNPYNVMIMRIGLGNIIKGDNPLYAPGIRYKDARLCHVGVLGL